MPNNHFINDTDYQRQLFLLTQHHEQRSKIDDCMIPAIQSGQKDEVKNLIDEGLNPTFSALYEAVRYRQTEIVELCLQHKIDLNSTLNRYDPKPIIVAILNNDLETVEILVRHRPDYDTSDCILTPSFLNTLPYILQHYKVVLNKLEPNTKFSPLSLAQHLEQTEIVNYLEQVRIEQAKIEQARIKRAMSVSGDVMHNPNAADNPDFPPRI